MTGTTVNGVITLAASGAPNANVNANLTFNGTTLAVTGNATISGDLTVSGTTTYINTTTLNVGDNIITLNADIGASTAPTENAGIEVKRGNASTVSFYWNESTDRWYADNTFEVNGNVILSGTIDTGQGATEVYLMNQNIRTTDAVTFATVNTGQGANELYAMDQNVRTSDNVQFANVTATGFVRATNGFIASDNVRIFAPQGASYVTSASTVTGAWKIKLPVSKNNSSTMMRMTVKIYQYNTGKSHTFYIG